jgi:hypothetical protein
VKAKLAATIKINPAVFLCGEMLDWDAPTGATYSLHVLQTDVPQVRGDAVFECGKKIAISDATENQLC